MNFDTEKLIELIQELCKIPAPSGYEEKRAEFCRNWLTDKGAEGVYIDEAKNVLYPVNCEGKNDIVLFLAHTDTVFPDMEEMPFKRDEEYLYAPGVGDDTTCLAMLLTVAGYVAENSLKSKRGVLFAANSCEEGLGNLKGTKQIFKDFQGRIKEVYAFDSQYTCMINRCVGSHRYKITFETKGGHSFNDFGNKNAIHAMSEFVCELYNCQLPVDGDSKTTYNVGLANGGTSVNTIAQEASVYYEYRSDSLTCLSKMEEFFNSKILQARENTDVKISVEVLGQRPCQGEVDPGVLEAISQKVIFVCEKHSGLPCRPKAGSTDCNIPMSLGIPAVAVGSYLGEGEHTREEKVLLDSIPVGMKIVADLVLENFNKDKNHD